MFSRLDDLMAGTGALCVLSGVYLWAGLPALLIVLGGILIYAGWRYEPGAGEEARGE